MRHTQRGARSSITSTTRATKITLMTLAWSSSRRSRGRRRAREVVPNAEINPLAAEPVALTGHKIGYARVGAGSQRLDRQTDALTAAGCRRIFADKKSGKDADRPELAAALDFMRSGDTLVVPSLDRLSHSLQNLITMVGDLRKRQVGFTSLHENLDTTTPGGRLIFHVFGVE